MKEEEDNDRMGRMKIINEDTEEVMRQDNDGRQEERRRTKKTCRRKWKKDEANIAERQVLTCQTRPAVPTCVTHPLFPGLLSA